MFPLIPSWYECFKLKTVILTQHIEEMNSTDREILVCSHFGETAMESF